MNSVQTILITILSLIIAIPISRLLVNQLGKVIAAKIKPYLYLIIAIMPMYEMIRLILNFPKFYQISFFYFWVIFLVGLLIIFLIELITGK